MPTAGPFLNLTLLAVLELALLAGGGLAAHRLVRRVGRGERRLVLMVSVATWLVLFGMVPFFAFAALVPTARSGHQGAGALALVVLNGVPFTLVASPLLGAAQALAARGRSLH
ncbi:MAG: hypothetical protein NVSMB32_11190 [Actinomycetota bacterium]